MHCACMLSIHSPDDIFMALVSIFISKTHTHFWSALRIENDTYKLRTLFLFKCARKMTRKVRINKITALISRITVIGFSFNCRNETGLTIMLHIVFGFVN